MIAVALSFAKAYWRPIALVLMVVALVLAVYGKGRNDERVKWQKRTDALLIEAAKETQRLVEKNYVIEQQIVKTIERERIVTRNIVEQVNVLIPADACPLPGGFRVLHDAAARGDDPAPAGGTNAPAVAAQDAARTVVDNYGTCREDRERLIALQAWARDVASTPILCKQP
jgi:hypothetical protein